MNGPIENHPAKPNPPAVSTTQADIDRAVAILQSGGLVAFPTETVYGLGADATNAMAVRKIFLAKNRPSINPLIVHVCDVASAKRYVTTWPLKAQQLADAFWPGPLTLVLPRRDSIVPEVSAGRNTVGLRVPNHELALRLLRAFGGAVAAPSANRANHISPTLAEHVRQELGASVDLILDGGPCAVGIESTVLDLTGSNPCILRPGGISRTQIEAIMGPVDQFQGSIASDQPAASPGQQHRHYSPRTPAHLFDHDELSAILHIAKDPGIGLLLWEDQVTIGECHGVAKIVLPANAAQYARELYAALRRLDEMNLKGIYIQMPPAGVEWAAVLDRLTRAAQPRSSQIKSAHPPIR